MDQLLTLIEVNKEIININITPYCDNKPSLIFIKLIIIIENINKSLTLIEKIKKFVLIQEEFTIENKMLTPTLKLKRKEIIKNYKQRLENLY